MKKLCMMESNYIESNTIKKERARANGKKTYSLTHTEKKRKIAIRMVVENLTLSPFHQV